MSPTIPHTVPVRPMYAFAKTIREEGIPLEPLLVRAGISLATYEDPYSLVRVAAIRGYGDVRDAVQRESAAARLLRLPSGSSHRGNCHTLHLSPASAVLRYPLSPRNRTGWLLQTIVGLSMARNPLELWRPFRARRRPRSAQRSPRRRQRGSPPAPRAPRSRGWSTRRPRADTRSI